MTIYFIQVLLLWVAGFFRKTTPDKTFRKVYLVFAGICLVLVAGLRQYTVGTDLDHHYAREYTMLADTSWKQIPKLNITYEVGYRYYCKILSIFSSNVQYFIFVTSLITIGIFLWFVYENSVDIVMSTLLFVLYCINYMYYNVIRQAVAVSIVLIGYHFLKKRDLGIIRYAAFAAFIVLASTFHSSAILCLLIIVFNIASRYPVRLLPSLLITLIVFMFYGELFTFLNGNVFAGTSNYDRYTSSGSIAAEGQGYFSRQPLGDVCLCAGALLLAYFLMVRKNRGGEVISAQHDSLAYRIQDERLIIYSSLICFICRLLVFRMNILYRVSYYFVPFVLLLYPLAISRLEKNTRIVVSTVIYIIFFIYFAWMTVAYAGNLYGTVPYKFYWEL